MRTFKLALPMALALLSQLAFADMKFGFVDMQRALEEIGEGKAAKDRLKTDLEKKKVAFESEQNKLRMEKEEFDKRANMMTEEARNQKMMDMQKRLVELTQKAEKLQYELANTERTELDKIFSKMRPIVDEIAARDGLSLMLERSDSGIIYAPSSLDYTNELVRRYNEKYKVGTKAASATPAKDAAKEPAKK